MTLVGELSLALTHLIDPGIIAPASEPDPLIVALERGGDGCEAATREALASDVRKESSTGVWSRRIADDGGDTAVVFLLEEKDKDGATASSSYAGREKYCTSCVIWRPPRASHCAQCGWCVVRFDHHCGAVGNCIGANNNRWFVCFLIAGAYVFTRLLFATCAVLFRRGWPFARTASWSEMETYAYLGLAVAFFNPALLSVFAAFHVWIFICNVTTKDVAARGRGCDTLFGALCGGVFKCMDNPSCVVKHCENVCLDGTCRLKSHVETQWRRKRTASV